MSATDDWLTSLRDKNAAKLGAALSYDRVKPDQAAEADQVGRALGVPPALVTSQPDLYKRQLDQKKFTESLKGAPATAAWVRDMQNGALAKDDLDNLTWFERELKPFASTGGPDGPFGVVAGVGRSIARGARRAMAIPSQMRSGKAGQLIADYGKTLDELIADEMAQVGGENAPASMRVPAMQAAQLRFDAVQGMTEEQRAEILQQGADDLTKAREILDRAASVEMSGGATQFRDTTFANSENTVLGALGAFAQDPVGGAAFLVETAAEFLPMMAAATGVTIATRSPGLGAMAMGIGSGLTENTTGAMEFLAENGVDLSTPESALAVLENAELMQAAADRGLTRGLIIGLMDAASGGVAGQTLMQSPAGDMVAQGLAQVVFGAGGEGLAQAASGQEIDWRDIVIEGLAELVTAPVEVLGVGGRGVLRRLQRGANETALPDTLDKIDDMAAASKLKQRSPDKFAEAVGQQELGEVYVPASKLREFFQAKDMTGEEWGFDPEYLGEQAMAGAHVPLPLSTYASTISGTEDAVWVRENAVFDPDEFSASEAAEFNDQVQDILRDAREEAEAAIEEDRALRAADVQIYDSVFSQLRAAGRSPDVANYEARVMSSFWRTMGERYGEDPLELAKSMGLRIQGPQTPDVARRRGDLDIRLNALRADEKKALKPYGESLIDFIVSEGGIQDVGGDVASFEPPKGVVAETREEIMDRRSQPTIGAMPALGKGIGLDEMARLANEAGYLDTEDTNDLLAAIGASLAGEPVYRIGEGVDPAMEALAEELSRRAIDLTEMTNDEVAAALEESDGRAFEQAAPEGSDAFREWFGDSKVVDGNGDPLVVYHGTNQNFEEFDRGRIGENTSAASSTDFFFTENPEEAAEYADLAARTQIQDAPFVEKKVAEIQRKIAVAEKRGDWDAVELLTTEWEVLELGAIQAPDAGQQIIPVYLSIKNPAVVDAKGSFDAHAVAEAIVAAKRNGSDGVKIMNAYDPVGDRVSAFTTTQWVAFSPTQIKSVNNRGTFDAGDPRILYQPAYHGSPHIFDKFSTKYMGTGEGAQAFGWGMYFAGRKEVAEGYRKTLAGSMARTANSMNPSDIAFGAMRQFNGNRNSAAAWLEQNLQDVDLGDSVPRYQEAIKILRSDEKISEPGRTYKVDVPEDSDLLAWDAPLSDQPEKVKAAIRAMPYAPDEAVWENITGSDFYEQVRVEMMGDDAFLANSAVRHARRADGGKAASLALNDAGIPGHRFLDQGSRSDGEGTYNYVIYDDDMVRILEFEQTKRGSIVLPSGGLQSGETVINLFEQANLSTFLHESSHYFLEAFSTLADSPNAPEAMRKDMATIREWLGNDGGPFTTEQHEQWARGGEAYFMEGKAPSLDLADAFARFKSWLTRIYRSIQGLNVKITPEIREVMDRMLATDAEIAEARAEQEMRPLFTEAPTGMSKTDFQTYQRMAQRSADQAEQRLIDKTMATVRRERETWYKEEKKAVRKEVEASVNKQREYRLTEALSNRRWFDADGEATEMPDMRMDRQGLIDLFGDGVLKEIDRAKFGGKYAIYTKDGDNPRDVAEFFGFKSASEMLDVLQNAPKRKDAIDAEVERVMTERHGDPLNDGTIEEEALRAIHNDQQANTVVAEVRHLAGQIGRKTTNLSARVYRHRARAMLGRMTVKEAAKPHVFLSAERRAANNAQTAFAKVARGGGEAALAEAYQAKEQQLLNHMLYNEAKEFEAKLQRGREKMRSYSKKSVREKLAGGYIEQIDDLLERFDFRKRSPGQVARSESLQEYVTRMEAEGRESELAIDVRLLDEARRTHYTRLTVEEFNGLTDTIANIDHMGRFKQDLIERNRKRKLAESAANVEGAIRKSQKASDRRDSSRGMQALNLIRRPDTIMVDLDGGKEMGIVYDELKRGIDEGQAEEQKAQVKMAEDFDALFNGHYSSKELRAMVEAKAIPGVSAREWSKQEILALALNMGAQENHQRVFDQNVDPEMRMDPDTLQKLLSTLDENDWRFVQGMWDMVNSYWPDLAAVHKRRTGVEPDKVQAQLMYDGAPDFVRGGYYPIKYDATRGSSAARDEQSAWDKFLTAGHGSTAAVKNGMTKQRQQTGGGRTIKYDLNVPFQHLRETVRYIALSEAVDNAYRILNHDDVVRAFQDTGNADTLKTLNLWVKDTAQGPIFNTDLLNSMARMVKNNFTLSKLAFNLKTVILQATGIGQSAATIGKMNMARGFAAYMKRPHQMIEDVTQKSALMAERQTTFQKDIYDFINDVKVQSPLAGAWSRSKKTIAQAGFWPMIKMQFLMVDMPTWIGAYDAGLRRYDGDDAKAVHYADRMVVRAQDSGLFADRAAVERGTVSENVRQADFIRLFTTLGGYMLTKLNRMNITAKQTVLGVSEADTSAKKAAAAFNGAADMMLLLMFEPMLMALIYSLATDDDEPEDVAEFIAVEMGMATVGGIPVVRDMASAARGYGGGGVYGSVLEMPYRAGVQAAQGEVDSAFVKAMGDLVGVATGMPTTAFTRLVSPIFDDDASTAEVLMGRNPLAN